MERKKMGRPFKTENKKDARLQLRITEEDKKEVKKMAIDMDMTTSEFFIYAAKKLMKEIKEGE